MDVFARVSLVTKGSLVNCHSDVSGQAGDMWTVYVVVMVPGVMGAAGNTTVNTTGYTTVGTPLPVTQQPVAPLPVTQQPVTPPTTGTVARHHRPRVQYPDTTDTEKSRNSSNSQKIKKFVKFSENQEIQHR